MISIRHVQRTRKVGGHCNAACALCYLAAVDMLSGRKDRAQAILALQGAETVEIDGDTTWLDEIAERLPTAVQVAS